MFTFIFCGQSRISWAEADRNEAHDEITERDLVPTMGVPASRLFPFSGCLGRKYEPWPLFFEPNKYLRCVSITGKVLPFLALRF